MSKAKFCKSRHSMIPRSTSLPEILQLELYKHSLEGAIKRTKVSLFKTIYSLFSVSNR